MEGAPPALHERDEIGRALMADPMASWAANSRRVRRHPSTVARTVARGGGRGRCRPATAQRRAERAAHRRLGRPQVLHRRRVQRAHRAIQRRRRRHRAEQALLGAQILDIGPRLPAAGEHQHRLGQHLAPTMDRRPLTRPPHTTRQRRRRTQPINKHPQSVQPHITNQPAAAAALYPHLTHTVRLHLGNASLPGTETRVYTRIIPPQRGIPADAHPHHPTPREQSGLDVQTVPAVVHLP